MMSEEDPLEESTRSVTRFGSKMTNDSLLFGDDNYFGTLGPNDEIFSVRDLMLEGVVQKQNSEEFEQNLHDSIRGIKQLIESCKA